MYNSFDSVVCWRAPALAVLSLLCASCVLPHPELRVLASLCPGRPGVRSEPTQ